MSKAVSATGVVLAGGLSRRMGGGDKGLLDIGGATMLERVVERLRPQVARLIVNANGDPARFAWLGLPVVPDTVAGFAGPLAGILAGMRWSLRHAPEVQRIVTVASDVPFLPADLAARLAAAADEGSAVIAQARSQGVLHPVIGSWPVTLADDLEQQLTAGVRKMLAWVDRHAATEVDFEMLDIAGRLVDPFFNVNTPADAALARSILAAGPDQA